MFNSGLRYRGSFAFFSLLCCLVIVAFSPIPTMADSSFPVLPVNSDTSSSGMLANGLYCGQIVGGSHDGAGIYLSTTNSSPDFYVFVASIDGDLQLVVCCDGAFASSSAGVYAYNYYRTDYTSASGLATWNSTNNYDSVLDVSYGVIPNSIFRPVSVTPSIPEFADLSSGLSAFRDFIDGQSSSGSIYLLPQSDVSASASYSGLTSYYSRGTHYVGVQPCYVAVDSPSVYLAFYLATDHPNPVLLSESAFNYTEWSCSYNANPASYSRNPDPYAAASVPSATYGNFYYADIGNSLNSVDEGEYVYPSLSDAVAAVRSYIDNPPVSPEYEGISAFYLPAGNVAYIDVSDAALPYSISLRQDFGVNSSLIGSPWNSNQYFGWAVAFPAPYMSYPRAGGSAGFSDALIDWNKQAPTNGLGQTTNGVKTYTGESLPSASGDMAKYAVVVNPLYAPSVSNSGFDYNKAIRIIVKGASSIRVYPLTAEMSSSGVTNMIDGSYSSGDVESPSSDPVISWDTEPSFGGNNQVPSADAADSAIQRLLQGLLGIFTRGGEAIQSLVTAGSEFMNSMSALFSWMPPPLLDVVVSAVVLFVIIGVLKLLL